MEFIIKDGMLTEVHMEKTDTHIVIPDGCCGIADGVFSGMDQLISVTLPASVYRIGADAFSNCINLHEINLENVEEMGEAAFCASGLKSIRLGNMDFVATCAFMSCEHLSEVIFSDTIQKVEEYAFGSCHMLENIDLKNTEIIEDCAFDDCRKLKRIKVRQLKEVGYCSFPDETVLQYPELLDGAVVSDIAQIMGETLHFKEARSNYHWYYGNKGIYFEYGYQTITDVVADEAHFEGLSLYGKVEERFCEKIKYVVIPDKVVKIEKGAFADCINLETIVLHDGMEICIDAFKNCPKLKNVVINGYNPESCRFFVSEYYDPMNSLPIRRFRYMDSELGYCDHIGEASFREDPCLAILKQHNCESIKNVLYGDTNIVLRSHWIRMNYYAFDNFANLVFCSEVNL